MMASIFNSSFTRVCDCLGWGKGWQQTCLASLPVVGVLLAVAGCGEAPHSHEDHVHGDTGHAHHHVAPHGGAAVVLGDELYHLEFLVDSDAGILDCYVLDGHMESFVRIRAESVRVTLEDGRELLLQAVASRLTGETIGDTSHFQTPFQGSGEEMRFSATVEAITIKGTRFESIPFRYPEGNESP